ncbi:MAG: reverse transcriptase family protein, partial [Candidatus Thiodiazotropha sp.]
GEGHERPALYTNESNSSFGANPKQKLNFATLNVCGLKSRLNYPDFVTFFNSYDFVCFAETKLDDTDIVSLPGFICISQPRKQTFIRKSGGMAFCVKENLAKYSKHIDSQSDYVMWIQLDKTLLGSDENLMLGICYVPPTQSKYYNAEEILNLEREITSACSNNKYVFITGDINARTAKLRDYIRADDFLSDIFDFDDETRSFFDKVNILEQYNIPTERATTDSKTNNTGNWLIETCKNNNLFIVNGRVGKDKFLGAPTFRDKSLIDYTICTAECFAWLSNFEIIEMDTIFSDGHSLLSWSLLEEGLNTYQTSNSMNDKKNIQPKYKWSENTKEQFIAHIDLPKVLHVKQRLETMELNSENINRYTNEISILFEEAAQKSLKQTKTLYNKRPFDKPWFGPACKMARKQYHKAKRMYKSNKCQRLKNNLHIQSKNFKKVMNKYILLFKIDKAKKLRNMQYKSPKEYWKYLNSLNNNKKPRPQPTIGEFYEHYKNLNENKYDSDNDINMHLNDTDEILNSYITSDEIRKCINNLKNGKSAGGDHILNEYLKSTKEIFLPVYETLFNKIFDSGILPTSWLEGSITPIYKNKGNSSEPKNYRPITILSCLGKVFTAVLNNRLTNFLNNSNMLNENQAGFRKEYSTSDHIFVLSSLIEILKVKKQKLFCAFVDFSQAFDSVWRGGLWRKLLFNSIKGKFFQIVYNMYDNIKSCVKFNNQSSTFFACKNGVRQGENLSPLLFAMYLNDLESYILASGTEPINLEFQNDETIYFLKLLILLYADDTIIFSNDKDDFQKALDAFQEYCQMWKLQINYDKTNI